MPKKKKQKRDKLLIQPPRTPEIGLIKALENYNLTFGGAPTPEEAVLNFTTYYPVIRQFVEDNVANLLIDALQLRILAGDIKPQQVFQHDFEAKDPESFDLYKLYFCKHCGKHEKHEIHSNQKPATLRYIGEHLGP